MVFGLTGSIDGESSHCLQMSEVLSNTRCLKGNESSQPTSGWCHRGLHVSRSGHGGIPLTAPSCAIVPTYPSPSKFLTCFSLPGEHLRTSEIRTMLFQMYVAWTANDTPLPQQPLTSIPHTFFFSSPWNLYLICGAQKRLIRPNFVKKDKQNKTPINLRCFRQLSFCLH